ncbi:hypothetical protein IKF32_01695 [Candidatus Saccharibacteria bacterium]|nr:hypothetical protein [Candidatus Saccharibacteria bacterium]
MIKKYIYCGLLIILSMLFVGILNVSDTYADSYVRSATVSWKPGYSWRVDGGWHAQFIVNLVFGESCGGKCQIQSTPEYQEYFWCNDGGTNKDEWGGDTASNTSGGGTSTDIRTTLINRASNPRTYANLLGSESNKYDLYYVDIIPPESNWQPLRGIIRKRKSYTLTIETSAGASVSVERKTTSAGVALGGLSSGADIYTDDKLKICANITNGYTLQAYTVQEGSNSPVNISPLDKYCVDLDSGQYKVVNDTKIVLRAVRNEFYGKSMVSSSNDVWSSANGVSLGANDTFTQSSGKVTYYINNCDPVNGCTAKFWHYLKRGGSGSTSYKITRTSNYASVESTEVVGRTTESFGSGDTVKVLEESFVGLLKPGQVVCETLTFTANAVDGDKSLTVCASALGDAQPPDPDPDTKEEPGSQPSDKTFLNIKVRNSSVAKYAEFQRSVYAKPGDNLVYRSVYNPVLQYTYNLIPEKMKIDSYETIFPMVGNNANHLGELFNANRNNVSNDLNNWNNAYAVNSENFSISSVNDNYIYNSGDNARKSNSNEHTVMSSEVGKSLNEIAKTNTLNENQTTPSQVTFTKYDADGTDYNLANVKTAQISRVAYAKVPYNYRTAIDVTSDAETVGAGEDGKIDIIVDVLTKTNSETTGGDASEAYATKTPGMTIKLVVYTPDAGTNKTGDENFVMDGGGLCARYYGASQCAEKNVATGRVLNSNGDLNGKTGDGVKGVTFNVPDLDAGAEICVAAAVYPSNSGSDTNLDTSGNDRWNVSNSKCFKIMKKPSIQVWGGSIFSKKSIKTPVSKKNNISGYAAYDINSKNRFFVFGSWAELDIISLGAVTGLSSGAGAGFAHNDNGALWPSYNYDNSYNYEALSNYGPGGSLETSANYCLRSTLTFANDNCSRGVAGALGGSGSSDSEKNKNALISRFTDSNTSNIEYQKYNSELVITDNITAGQGSTKVIDAQAVNVKIDHDIEFLSGQTYKKIEDIPKLIIIAKNIMINCGVSRIDAVLIAEKEVKTCYNSSDVNSRMNSNQLIINGSIIADTMSADRTYGAAKGANSIIPAEIVNYDATLYLWGANRASVAESGSLSTVYIHEIAPRF